jgi:hypothetical protein
MKVNVFHHVYSSVGGYRTVMQSNGIPASTVQALEEYSRPAHKLARRNPRFSLLGFDEIFTGISRLNLAGSDHVGRTRACVHNILVRRDEVEKALFFDIFQVPQELFLTGTGDIAREANSLPTSFDFSPRNPVTAYPLDAVPQRTARNLMRCMLHEGSTILQGTEAQTLTAVRAQISLLPPVARDSVTLVTGDYISPLDGKGRHMVFLVPPEFDAASYIEHGLPVLVDGGVNGHNLPRTHPWGKLVLGLLYGSDEDRRSLFTLLRAVNTYSPIVSYTPEMYKNLVAGFNIARQFFQKDGHLHVEGAPEKGLEGALAFFRAGHPDIVFDIFNACLHMLGKRHLTEGLENFEHVVQSGIDTLKEFFAEAPADEPLLDDIGDFD